MRKFLVISAVLAVAAVPASLSAVPSATTATVCVEEDGSTPEQAFPCYWDATERGNGSGTSFWLTAESVK